MPWRKSENLVDPEPAVADDSIGGVSPGTPGQTGGCSGKDDGGRLELPVPTSHEVVPVNSDGDASASGRDTLGSWNVCPIVMDAGDTDSSVADPAGAGDALRTRLRNALGVSADEYGSASPPSQGGAVAPPATEPTGVVVAAAVGQCSCNLNLRLWLAVAVAVSGCGCGCE